MLRVSTRYHSHVEPAHNNNTPHPFYDLFDGEMVRTEFFNPVKDINFEKNILGCNLRLLLDGGPL